MPLKEIVSKLQRIPNEGGLKQELRRASLLAAQELLQAQLKRQEELSSADSPSLTAALKQFDQVIRKVQQAFPDLATVLNPRQRLAVIDLAEAFTRSYRP